MNAIVVPIEGPLMEVQLNGTLVQLQRLVEGLIEAVPLPAVIEDADAAAGYVNRDGVRRTWSRTLPDGTRVLGSSGVNPRATEIMYPSSVGGYVVGPLVLCGLDPDTGSHVDVPAGVVRRARLIEREAA